LGGVPLLMVQEISEESIEGKSPLDAEVIAIAVYNNSAGVPLTVSTRRLFDGNERFYFPTEVTEGHTKTRLVYRLTVAQWRELLGSLAGQSAPDALKQIMIPMLIYLRERFPRHFSDIEYDRSFDPHQYADVLPVR